MFLLYAVLFSVSVYLDVSEYSRLLWPHTHPFSLLLKTVCFAVQISTKLEVSLRSTWFTIKYQPQIQHEHDILNTRVCQSTPSYTHLVQCVLQFVSPRHPTHTWCSVCYSLSVHAILHTLGAVRVRVCQSTPSYTHLVQCGLEFVSPRHPTHTWCSVD